jgi:hypothetical protein
LNLRQPSPDHFLKKEELMKIKAWGRPATPAAYACCTCGCIFVKQKVESAYEGFLLISISIENILISFMDREK